MSLCPTCNTELKGDFGLVICNHCQAQVLLDIDGSAQLAAPPNSESSTDQQFASTSEPYAEIDPSNEPPMNNQPSTPQEELPTANPNDGLEMFVATPEFSPDFAEPQNLDAAPSDNSPIFTATPIEPMKEVVNFANKVSNNKDEGHFRYNILVDGIDSADIRQDIVEVLSDSKFAWNKDIILKELKSGQLKILAVPAVKSAILIQRLRHLPLNISWEQYEIHQDAR